MKLTSLLILLFLISCNENAIYQKSKVDLIEELVSDLYKKHQFNGALVIGEKGKIIFSKGFGYSDFQDSIPFTPFTPSDGGSNAKTLTATAILILEQQGKLKLEDSIQRYLPEYPYYNTTIHNLITHSIGGLPDYDHFFEKANDTDIITNEFNLKIIRQNRPTLFHEPSTNFDYDNVGFDFAALVAERITKKDYGQFLRENIFDPLKMDSTFIRPAKLDTWKGKRTIGYRYVNDSLKLFDIEDREGFYGGCNIWFSANDLYSWGQSFYNNKILSDTLIKKITSEVLINGMISRVRLGAWYVGKSKSAFYYWGNVAGFYSFVYWDMNKHFTIAFMTNTAMPQWVRPLLTSALIDIMKGTEYLPIKKPQADSIYLNNLEQITGTYEIENLGEVRISIRQSKLILNLNNSLEYRMHLVDKKTFYVPGFDPWISFSSMKENKFQNIYWSSTILQATGKRISN